MAATSTASTPVPPVHSLVKITNAPPPGPILWVDTTRGYINPYSRVPLANAIWLHALPFHPPTAPLPS